MTKLKTLSVYFAPPSRLKSIFESPSSVVDFFSYVLCPTDSIRIKSITITFCDQSEVVDLEDSLQVKQVFDFDRYILLQEKEKRVFVLEIVCSVICELGKRFGWDIEHVEKAADFVSRSDFFFTGVLGKAKTSPNRQRKADIWVTYKRKIELFVRVFESNELKHQELFSVGEAGFPSFKESFSQLKWVDNSRLQIYAGNRRDYWEYSVGGSPEFIFCREDGGDGHGEFILGKMYLEGRVVLRNEEKGRYLIRLSAEKGYLHATRFLQGEILC